MQYFTDEQAVEALACGVIVENRVDRVRVGESDITRDRLGLKLARALLGTTHESEVRTVLGGLVQTLEALDRDRKLPDRISVAKPKTGPSVCGRTKPAFIK